jgi:hypothetical protein
VCWELWKERNCRIFDKKEIPVHAMISRIMEEIDVWRIAAAHIPLVV